MINNRMGELIMLNIAYITDKDGQQKAVVIPIELWRKILPPKNASVEDISEEVENYCLNKAMDEAERGPLLNRKEALAFLKE
jgi:hypothetical protein